GSLTSISRGKPFADFPWAQPAAWAPAPSVNRTYGLPATVIGSAFWAATLPSSQVRLPMTRTSGLTLRDWKSLTSRITSPFAAAVDPVPRTATYAMFPSLLNSRSSNRGLKGGGARKKPLLRQPNDPAAQGINLGCVTSLASRTTRL